jgi:hypothetical protein|tara:strand:- start:377 stop:688 length:312 start_codon:yes stop_codon:yes gene_type:complete
MKYLEVRVADVRIRRAVDSAFSSEGPGKIPVRSLIERIEKNLKFNPFKIVHIEKGKLVDMERGESYTKDDTEYYPIDKSGNVSYSELKCMRDQLEIIDKSKWD